MLKVRPIEKIMAEYPAFSEINPSAKSSNKNESHKGH
jgi:hypothetical protein